MNQRFFFLLLAAVLCLLLVTAQAETVHAYEPYQTLHNTRATTQQHDFTGSFEAVTGSSYTYSLASQPSNVDRYVWRMAYDDTAITGKTALGTRRIETTSNNSFTYTFPEPGSYYLFVTVYLKDGNVDSFGGYSYDMITVTAGSSQPLMEKVASVAAACRRAGVRGEYETALWLHDYLTQNAYYDLTYSNYGPEGVLLDGTGVCDSYSKAYRLLLSQFGIESYIRTGTTSGGAHAWNLVRLDGIWCLIDVTWDDPAGSSSAVSGYESHDYFGLSDELMNLDHRADSTPDYGIACTSLANNYYVRKGEGEYWGYFILPEIEDQLQVLLPDTVSVTTNNQVVINVTTYSNGYSMNSYTDNTGKIMTIYAYILSQKTWYCQEVPLKITFAYDRSTTVLTGNVSIDLTSALDMPDDLTVIEAQAFYKNPALVVMIPDSCTSIGSQAFAYSSVKVLYLPRNITIARNAFANASPVLVITKTGGTAESWARSFGCTVITQ